MEARLNLSGSPLAAKSMKYIASASKVIILINATNRLSVITRLLGGDYQAGQFE
jgi:hypothetical protein